MSILCTCPGRHGDVIWSLATVRAISETYGEPVDLLLSEKYGSLVGLIQRQAYIRDCSVDAAWAIEESAPITPRVPDLAAVRGWYERQFDLGYESWPTPDLARDIYHRANRDSLGRDRHLAPLDLSRPWITAPYAMPATDLSVGFTDEHFELKYGLYWLLLTAFNFSPTRSRSDVVFVGNSPRWTLEAERGATDWETAASWIRSSQVFVGCCSALHVLTVALGVPVICVEPNKDRHQDIFYPVGKSGAVQLLLGNDGQPTVDSRHLIDAIEAKLHPFKVEAQA